MPVVDTDALIANRVKSIRAYHEDAGVQKGSLDISGGIDSAVMAMLLVKALGAENCIFDHTIINTSLQQTDRARELCKALKVPLAIGHFNDIYRNIVDEVIDSMAYAVRDVQGEDSGANRLTEIKARMAADPTIEGSIRSTLRAPLGRAYNRIMGGGIRHGTGNECEDRFLRFYQKGGDGEVDTNPMAMLSKTEVYQLAYALGNQMGIYDAVKPIIEAVPSPDLWDTGDGHSDEAEFLSWTGVPFTYGRIDADTGKITSFGTIERVARFLDTPFTFPDQGPLDYHNVTAGDVLFGESSPSNWAAFVDKTSYNDIFTGFDFGEVDRLLRAARKAEAQTRHKENPAIPTLGTRLDLVDTGILTNELPKVAEGKGNS